MSKIKGRIRWIDYLKAFACVLVVLGHLIQSLQKSNIDNYQNITSFIDWFIYLFHMPLFFFISGYLYEKNKEDFTWKNYREFELKKIVNFIVPYFSFYLLYVGINIMFAQSVNYKLGMQNILNMFNNPISPYWFLYALLSIFIVVPLIEKILKNNRYFILGILVILKIISILVKTNIYFLDSIFSYTIYFYMANFVSIKNNCNAKKEYFSIISKIILYIILAIIIYLNINEINKYLMALIKEIFAVLGIYLCLKIFLNIKKSRFLDTIKKYTFQIYLLHTILGAGIRILLLKIGIQNYILHIVLGFIASIYIPVLISIICEKTKYLNFFFFPIKTIKQIKRSNRNNTEYIEK